METADLLYHQSRVPYHGLTFCSVPLVKSKSAKIVIDDTGENYLFEAGLFRAIDDLTSVATEVTVGLTWPMKAAIHRIASQRGISMSALIREWIDEHLDLPVSV